MDKNKRLLRSCKVLILLICFFTSYAGFAENKGDGKHSYCDLPELIRVGYDSINSSSFERIRLLLNDSILVKNQHLRLFLVTRINKVTETIDWFVFEFDNLPDFAGPDRAFLYIDLDKDSSIKIQKKVAQISDIHDFAVKYIFYPDSIGKKIIKRKSYIDQVGEVEISRALAVLRVNIGESKGLTFTEWKRLFDCLRELIEVFEGERNKISLKIWEKEFDDLQFNEKEIATDIVGYQIMLYFY